MIDDLSSKQYLEWRQLEDKRWSLVIHFKDGSDDWAILSADEPLEIRSPGIERLQQRVAELEGARHKNDRWNVETTAEGFRICRGYHERAEGCQWEYFVPRVSEPPSCAHPFARLGIDADGTMWCTKCFAKPLVIPVPFGDAVTKDAICPKCEGSGEDGPGWQNDINCTSCNGSGRVAVTKTDVCDDCGARGGQHYSLCSKGRAPETSVNQGGVHPREFKS